MVMGTLYGFYRDQLYNLLSQETKTATLEDARGALDLMVRELRNAGSWGSGSAPAGCSRVVTATATTIRIQADLDGNGDCTSDAGDNVTYDLTGSTITRKGVNNPLVDNVVLPAGSSFLTYYPSGSNPAPFCFPTGNPSGCSGDLAANLANIKRVKITVAVQMSNPNPNSRSANPYVSTTLSSSVEFRN